MEALRLDDIRQDVRKIVEPYLRKLLDIHKEIIISIVLYGSATGRYFVPKKSDINLAVIFKELGFSQLKRSLKLANQGINKKIASPLFLSLGQMESSKDIFPLEFIEIKENNSLLYGKDLFSNIQISESYIRLFCEREIKGKLIRLRQAYLEIGLMRKGIEALMKESMYSLIPVFRGLVRLKGHKPPMDKEEALTELCSHYGLDKNVFVAILRDKVNDEKIRGKDVEIFFERYLEQIEKLTEAVDRM